MLAPTAAILAILATSTLAHGGEGLHIESEDAGSTVPVFEGADIKDTRLPPWTPIESVDTPLEEPWAHGSTVGPGGKALAIHIGFPFLEVDYLLGIARSLELRSSFRTVYGGVAQLELSGRLRVLETEEARLTLRLGAAYATFSPDQAVMWLTRTRGLAVHPGAAFAMRIGNAVLFADAGLSIVIDVDPTRPPLAGPGDSLDVFLNLPLRLGTELPLSSKTSFVASAGFDLFLGNRVAGEPFALPHLKAGLSFSH